MDRHRWQTSSRCAADKPLCVAVRDDRAALRDTKNGDVDRVLPVAPAALAALLGFVTR